MAKILVVDDNPLDRRRAGQLLSTATGVEVAYAADGREALALLEGELPAVVLTDLQMPEMDGLELTEEVTKNYPAVPVIVMTAHGNEEVAVQALQRGAASYVPKRNLAQDLAPTVESVLELAKARGSTQRLLDCLKQTESNFVLENDTTLIAPLIGHLEGNLRRMRLCNENGLIRVSVALREALVNAIHHGNLEVSSDLRSGDEKLYYAQIDERRRREPYASRRVLVTARETRLQAVYVIRDEGPGFDPNRLPDPTEPENMERASGRGLLLIRTFMDDVRYNETGNEITMVKRCDV